VDVKTLTLSQWGMILSHAQHEAANQVAHLSVLLKERQVNAWLDMDAERLEARDMVRAIRNSKIFLLYLTKSYFTRYFCRLEASCARLLEKRVVIVYESDPRHGGMSDYVELVNEATVKRGYGSQWRDFLLNIEAIPMARRGFQRRAVIDEILKRSNLLAEAAPIPSQKSATSSSTSGGAAGGVVEAELRRQVVDLQMAVNDLRGENESLWKAIAELREQLG